MLGTIEDKRKKLKEDIQKERIEILDEEFAVWNNHCVPCTKIKEGIKSGILGKGTQKDKSNPVCEICPYQHIMRGYGNKLINSLQRERTLR
jgi:hypothetical protein